LLYAHRDRVSPVVSLTIAVTCPGLVGLQYYWFYKMVGAVRKRFVKGDGGVGKEGNVEGEGVEGEGGEGKGKADGKGRANGEVKEE
ncbi:hypothetical protein HDU93_001761, partial [Gonapodya sp. JEL0774]